MISFYPGPSRVHDEIPDYVKDAHKEGIMSMNHRSEEFVEISKNTIRLLRERLRIPKNYSILYVSSATECWEIIAQSLVLNKSYHVYSGAFGQKWFDYTQRLIPAAQGFPFNREERLNPNAFAFEKEEGVICLTQNETSNGTQVSNSIIRTFKKNNPNHLIAVDATSSMAGIELDFKAADIWFASVQKCFGLPAGLALMICSPVAVQRSKSIHEKKHYNSLPFMLEMMEKWQTPFTPNVLGIYLLMRVLQKMKPIREIHQKTEQRYKDWVNFFQHKKSLRLLIKSNGVRSFTVLPIEGEPDVVEKIKTSAKRKGILLGEGYGELKKNTFRIANFPAIKKKEIESLRTFLSDYH